MSKDKKYCGRCGASLFTFHEPAIKWPVYHPFGTFRLSLYDTETGKIRMIEVYRCPNYRKFFGFMHSFYTEHKDA